MAEKTNESINKFGTKLAVIGVIGMVWFATTIGSLFLGYSGVGAARTEIRLQAIRRGYAQYHPFTGKWEWKEHPRITLTYGLGCGKECSTCVEMDSAECITTRSYQWVTNSWVRHFNHKKQE